MQIKAVKAGLSVMEVPVSYRRRIGKSKVSGTIRGVIGAGNKILGTIFLFAIGTYPDKENPRSREALVLFTRYPEPGKTKTRLIPALGTQGAADLQRRMTEKILERAWTLRETRDLSICVSFEGGTEMLMKQWLGPDVLFVPQAPGDLGERMHRAFEDMFKAGFACVVLIGSDCPGLTSEILHRAFEGLRENDMVLGPATDGGYYLIGMTRPIRPLFANIPWGTDRVLDVTLSIARDNDLRVFLVDSLQDLDRPEDIRDWDKALQERDSSNPTGEAVSDSNDRSNPAPAHAAEPAPAQESISVIIPTYNEALRLRSAVRRVQAEEDVQIIVVDGGSTDATVDTARFLGVDVIRSDKGRSRQMNGGAEHALGEILLFLHADTLLPQRWNHSVRRMLSGPGTAAGAFQFKLDRVLPFSRVIEKLVNLRSRVLQMPYGDQAIFLKAALFREVGGFADLPVMEDYALMQRLRKQGRIRIVPSPATTSARRWRRLGVFRTTVINQIIILAYWFSASPGTLTRLHRLGKDQRN
jgi:rSAM/selenodomain-associated transferase 2/rSAM/selenodomain-associated transferase 1